MKSISGLQSELQLLAVIAVQFLVPESSEEAMRKKEKKEKGSCILKYSCLINMLFQ